MPKIDSLRANAAGFNKSLTLIQALIKDLDDKMSLIRHQKSWRNDFYCIIFYLCKNTKKHYKNLTKFMYLEKIEQH